MKILVYKIYNFESELTCTKLDINIGNMLRGKRSMLKRLRLVNALDAVSTLEGSTKT